MLINCAAYQHGKRLGDIAPDQISEYVKRPECFVWVAIRDVRDATTEELFRGQVSAASEEHPFVS